MLETYMTGYVVHKTSGFSMNTYKLDMLLIFKHYPAPHIKRGVHHSLPGPLDKLKRSSRD